MGASLVMSESGGKLSGKDATTARLLKLAPWIAVLATSLPAPLVFLILFLTATATESAAVLSFAGRSLADPWICAGVSDRRFSPYLPPEMALKIARPISFGWNHGE